MNTSKTGNHSFFLLASVAALLTCFAVIARDRSAASSVIAVGQKAIPFHAKSVDGKTINFPDDYKGRIVLLDFWATWCPPCRAELPNVVDVYNQYHDKGFDVVSVSLDQPRQGPALMQFVKDNKMSWPQIYDGRYWEAAIAVQYGVHSIPFPVLVDGDTGAVIAFDTDARGDDLAKAVKRALAAKAKK